MSYVGAPVRINNTIWRTNNTLRPLADLGLRGIWVHAEHLVMGLLCAFVACAPPCLLLLSQRPGACVFVFVRVCVRVCVHVCVCVCVCVYRVFGREGGSKRERWGRGQDQRRRARTAWAAWARGAGGAHHSLAESLLHPPPLTHPLARLLPSARACDRASAG